MRNNGQHLILIRIKPERDHHGLAIVDSQLRDPGKSLEGLNGQRKIDIEVCRDSANVVREGPVKNIGHDFAELVEQRLDGQDKESRAERASLPHARPDRGAIGDALGVPDNMSVIQVEALVELNNRRGNANGQESVPKIVMGHAREGGCTADLAGWHI